MDEQIKKRDSSVDLMRFIGLTCIVLAHIGLPQETALFQSRTFDVPLMVFTSGLAFAGKTTGSYLPFIWKRTLRLVVPVYVFVTAYCLLNPLLSGWGLVDLYTSERIWGAFRLKLYPSIGYVWIIRVFLIVMLVTPVLVRLADALKKEISFAGVVCAMFVLQYFLIRWLDTPQSGWFVKDWLLYVAGYSAVFMLGLHLRRASKGIKVVYAVALSVLMAAYALSMEAEHGTWLRMQALKYPPSVYYLLWGALVSTLLWTCSGWWSVLLDNRLFTWIGRNTIWIYLWHIPFVNIVVGGPFDPWPWGLKYVFVYVCALMIYALQYRIVKLAENRWPDNRVTKFFVG